MTRELVEASDRIERARSNVPEDPLNYDFLYHVLEADENGQQPFRNENTLDSMFRLKSVSCLRRIAESEDKVYLAYLPTFSHSEWILLKLLILKMIMANHKVLHLKTL